VIILRDETQLQRRMKHRQEAQKRTENMLY
jgi:hypothetical protein